MKIYNKMSKKTYYKVSKIIMKKQKIILIKMEINNKMIKKFNYWMIKIISKKHKMINSCNI